MLKYYAEYLKLKFLFKNKNFKYDSGIYPSPAVRWLKERENVKRNIIKFEKEYNIERFKRFIFANLLYNSGFYIGFYDENFAEKNYLLYLKMKMIF